MSWCRTSLKIQKLSPPRRCQRLNAVLLRRKDTGLTVSRAVVKEEGITDTAGGAHFRTSPTPTRLPHSHVLTPGSNKTRARLLAEFSAAHPSRGAPCGVQVCRRAALRTALNRFRIGRVLFDGLESTASGTAPPPRRSRTLHSRRRLSEACMYSPRSLPRDGRPAGSIAGDAQLPVEEDAAGSSSVFFF